MSPHQPSFCALNETIAMNGAVRAAVKMTSEDETLIIVTADHSHVMTMGGYPTINNDIFGAYIVVVSLNSAIRLL